MGELYWIALSYHLPSDSSKSRVYLWRKLRELGAENLRPGIAVLPRTPGESAADAAASAEDPGDGRRRDAGRDAFSGGISGTGDGGAFSAQARSGYDRVIRRGM